MAAEVRLAAGQAQADVRPDGALVSRFATAGLDVLHPAGGTDPGGLFPLLPWSNRISGGGFRFGDRFHALEANFPGEPLPIHGNAWQRAWTVAQRSSDRLLLTLTSDGPGPFAYAARLGVRLSEDQFGVTLSLILTVTSRAREPLPYGFGFHPSFVRRRAMQLSAPAETVWLEDERHLPTASLTVREAPDWDFSLPRPLPARWINNAFDGWRGRAVIDDPETGRRLVVTARNLATMILYSPGADAPFFCLEPVSHPVDAHNAAGLPGLVVLQRGGRASAGMRLRVLPLEA